MKFFKKNQVIIYVSALMLVVAGYLNFTATNDLTTAAQISSSEEELAQMANIGDAQLVSSNVIQESNSSNNNAIVDNSVESGSDVSNDDMNKNDSVTTSSDNYRSNTDYFSSSKLERDTMYSQMIETYENILNSSNSLETQKQSATEEISKINNCKNSIMICENLIKTKGFDNVIVFVNGNSVSVIVDDQQLSAEKVAQIQNIVSREMNTKVEDIHISNK